MTPAARLAREDAITDALRAADAAIGDEQPSRHALAIIAAIKRLRDDRPARVPGTDRIDYLERVQEAAREAWNKAHGSAPGLSVLYPEYDASAGIPTPIGLLRCVTWRTQWRSGRIAWASEYYLDGQPITVAEIKAAGLAQRPTTRQRQKKEPTK